MNVVVLPARKNSKRIKNKNIKPFLGIPIIIRTIIKLKKSKIFDKIIVSTDSSKIKKIVEKYGAQVPYYRSKKLSDDHTGISEVVADLARWMKKNQWKAKYICCVLPTNPFLQDKYIKAGLKLIMKSNCKFVFSASPIKSNFFRSFFENKNKGIEMIFPKNYNKRSQDLKKAYIDCGIFYWAKPKSWILNNRIFSKKSMIVKIPNKLNYDIDTIDDWKRAEKFAKLNRKYL